MTSDSFSAALRNLGGVHVLPKPQPKAKSAKKGESGSSQHGVEGTRTSSLTPDQVLQVEDPELSIDVLQVESPDQGSKKKKRKPSSRQGLVSGVASEDPGKAILEVLGSDDEGEGGVRGTSEFGRYSVRKLIGLMSEIPSDQNWEKMEDDGLVANFKEIGSLWGQVTF